MKTPFETAYSDLSASIQSAMESALSNVIKNTRELAQARMIDAFDETAASQLFPHETLTLDERKEQAMQWAEDAACKALDNLRNSYVQGQIVNKAK
jgi:hypothetical protein